MGLWPPFLLPLHQCRLRYGLPDRLLKVRRKRCGFRFSGKVHRLPQLHPYELPELVAVEIDHGLPAYLRWIADQTRTEPASE